jgi:hypothetical protein
MTLEERDVDYILDEEEWDRLTSSFCPKCGYLWELHDTKDLEAVKRSPHGCPRDETNAVERWGRE